MDALARVQQIPGWLRPEDASKLDELARSAAGPILEIGTYRGKSAVLMALALADAGADAATVIFTVDVDRGGLERAAAEARARGVADRIVFVHGTAHAFARAYPHVRPAVVFVDGDHSLGGVRCDLAVLERIVPASARLLFHDFADPRNDDPACPETKVRPAVEASWVARDCDFLGAFGVCGLYMRRIARESSPGAIARLMPLAGPTDQYRHRLKSPAAARLRRLTRRISSRG